MALIELIKEGQEWGWSLGDRRVWSSREWECGEMEAFCIFFVIKINKNVSYSYSTFVYSSGAVEGAIEMGHRALPSLHVNLLPIHTKYYVYRNKVSYTCMHKYTIAFWCGCWHIIKIKFDTRYCFGTMN